MTYATRLALEERFGADEIRDLAPLPGAAGGLGLDGRFIGDDEALLDPQPPDPRLASVLADADAEIDSRLAIAYALPLPVGTYPLLAALASDLARLRLYDEAAPEHVRSRADAARAALAAIVDGDREVVGTAGVVARVMRAQVVSRERTFASGAADGARLRGLDHF